MSELLRETKPAPTTKSGPKVNISAADAVRLVVNTAVKMAENEPAIDVRSVASSSRGAGILIWIPGYVSNGDTIIVAESLVASPDAPQETQP